MSLPELPPEASVRASESLLGQWDFAQELKKSPVASILVRVILTSDRLVGLEFPKVRAWPGLVGRLRLTARTSTFMDEMGKWHVVLASALTDIPEPSLGRVDFARESALTSNRHLVVGTKRLPVGEDPIADVMLARIRGQRTAVRAVPRQALR